MKKDRNYYKIKKAISQLLLYVVVCGLATVCLIPLYWMIRSSFMRNTDIYVMDPFIVWPKEMLWSNYIDTVNFMPFLKYTGNTLIILCGSMVGVLLTASLAAYAFARVSWRGRNICFFLILTTMMLPASVTIVPQFMIWKNLKSLDTYVPLILPAFLGGGAFNIFLLRQFFLGIPKDLDEAAYIDGAGHVRVFFQIILPLSKSALIVVGLFTFLNCWNEFFAPLIYLSDQNKYTLALGLLQFRGNYTSKWQLLMAASTIVAAPCILVYLLGQRYLLEGISMTGMKA
ncbi:MAG: carbohydrate ABC transporter permease [Eubacteriales bacterium]|nr:carbohydrate ABC transporter permease [Eubacteriales bacterium]